MPYAVWTKVGGTELDKYKIDGMPELPCGVAVKITDEQRKVAEHLLGVIVFDKVQGVEDSLGQSKEIEFEGKKYVKHANGHWDPPIPEDVYQRMVEEGVI